MHIKLTLYLIIAVFIKFLHGKPSCSNGLYQHWVPETGDFFCCREVSVKRGYAAIPCTEDGTEDHVQECPNGTHQPDNTSSRHMPHCIPDPECTDEGIRKDFKSIDEYYWPVCICSLDDGKCGLDPFHCMDIEQIKCPFKVLQNCSCAPTSTLLTSPPTTSSSKTVKPINPEFTKQTLVPTLTTESWTDSTKAIDTVNTTEDGTGKKNEWIISTAIGTGCVFLGVVVVVLYHSYVRCCRKNDNRLKEAEEQALIPPNGQAIVMDELNIRIHTTPEHAERVRRQPTPPQPRPRVTGSFPVPALPRPQSDHSELNGTSEIYNSTGSNSSHEANAEPKIGADDPDGSDLSQGSNPDHGSEETDRSRNHMSHGLNTELGSEPDDLGVSDLSQGSSADCRSEKADVNGHNMSHGSNTECGSEVLSYPSIKCAETSLQRVLPVGIVAPMMRQQQINQSSVVSQVENNQSLLGSLGPSLNPDSLVTENSIGEEEASNAQPREAIRESQSGDSTSQIEANMLGQLQLCTKANTGEQSGTVQAYDPENTDIMKVISQNEASETITQAVDSENTLLMKPVTEEDFSTDFGQMTGAARNYANINVMNKPEESLAKKSPKNCSAVLSPDFQAELNVEPSQKMNSVYHTQGQSEQVLAGQNNSTQKLCSDINASSNEKLEVIKDATSHELDTSYYSYSGVNLHLSSFMSRDLLLHTESKNAQNIFPSPPTESEQTEGNNFDGKSLHGRLENATLDGENQWLTSRQWHSLHSLQSLVQEQSVLQKLPQMFRKSITSHKGPLKPLFKRFIQASLAEAWQRFSYSGIRIQNHFVCLDSL